MLLNQDTAISTSKILLVPYLKHHVPIYHEWMQDAVWTYRAQLPVSNILTRLKEIQATTASEPLTLAQEDEMQKSWRSDVDKLTFIVCSQLGHDSKASSVVARKMSPPEPQLHEHDDSKIMIGDVNLFLSLDEEREGSGDPPGVIGELELMIAQKTQQGRGFGTATMITFLRYIATNESDIVRPFALAQSSKAKPHFEDGATARLIKCIYLRARITATNVRSLHLFTKLGFRKVSEEPNYFGEIELRLEDWSIERLDQLMADHGLEGYSEIAYSLQAP